MKRIWLLSIALLAVAAVEFGLLGAASAGASFVPGWLAASKDAQSAKREKPTATATPVSPPACQPDREHGGSRACDREPASIQLTPDPLVIRCDGYDRSTLTVRITDAKGHPVADGTYVSFWAYNGNTTPSSARTHGGTASTSVSFYADIFPPGPNVNVDVGPLEAGVRIRCFPESNRPPCSPPASSPSPPCATPTSTPPPCAPSSSPPSVSPPCGTPTPPSPPCSISPPSLSPPCATPTSWPAPTPCPTSPASLSPVCGNADIGSATIVVSASRSPQTVGVGFGVAVDLAAFAPGTSTAWAGYDLELAYDATVLQVNGDTRGMCAADSWTNVELVPRVVSGCFRQTITTSGTLETVWLTCLKDGSSELRLVGPDAPDRTASGTSLFDEFARPFATTLVSGWVQCGGPAPTATPSPTASAIPVG